MAMQSVEEKGIDVLVVAEPNKARARAKGVIMDRREDVAVLVAGGRGAKVVHRGDGVAGVRLGKLTLIAGYCSPNVDLQRFESFLEEIEIVVRQARGWCLACGDFNAKSPQCVLSRRHGRNSSYHSGGSEVGSL